MSTKKDTLGDRMKQYEYVNRTYLMRRSPVILRLDGKCFHSFTRGFKKPFDDVLIATMQETMKFLCENIQGCVLGYTQSDEITLVLIDYKELDSCAWFDNNIQKMCSVAASMTTLAFNRFFGTNMGLFSSQHTEIDFADGDRCIKFHESEYEKRYDAYTKAIDKGAMFDARAFNVPKEEVCNCILWRQNDATRNSIEMVGQAYFPHNELQNKSCAQIQDMLMIKKGINWNDFPTYQKRGSCCIKVKGDGDKRPKWVIDKAIPVFKGEGRKYVDDLIYCGELS